MPDGDEASDLRSVAEQCFQDGGPDKSSTAFIGHVLCQLETAGSDANAVESVLTAVEAVCCNGSDKSKDLLNLVAWDLLPVLAPCAARSRGCHESVRKVIVAMAETCSAQEMTTLFLEELRSAKSWAARLALLQGQAIAFPRVARKPAANFREAAPLLLAIAKEATCQSLATPTDEVLQEGPPEADSVGEGEGGCVENWAKEVALDALVELAYRLADSEVSPEDQRVSCRQVVANFTFQLTACLMEVKAPPWPPSSTPPAPPLAVELAQVLALCGITVGALLGGQGALQEVEASSQKGEDSESEDAEPGDAFLQGVALTAFHAVVFPQCRTALNGAEALSLNEAIQAVQLAGKLLEPHPSRQHSWLKGLQLLAGAASLAGVAAPERGGGQSSRRVPAVQPGGEGLPRETLRAFVEVLHRATVPLVLCPVAALRSFAHEALQAGLSLLAPLDRLEALEALMGEDQLPALVSLLFNRVKDEVLAAWPEGGAPADFSMPAQHSAGSPFLSPRVVELAGECLRPSQLGSPTELLEQADRAVGALNFLRFLLLREGACGTNHTGVREKGRLKSLREEVLLPMRTSAARAAEEVLGGGHDNGFDVGAQGGVGLGLDILREVLHRVIELVEEQLDAH